MSLIQCSRGRSRPRGNRWAKVALAVVAAMSLGVGPAVSAIPAGPVELTRAAHRLLPQIVEDTRYARAGLLLTDLTPAGAQRPIEIFRSRHEDAGIATLIDRVQNTTSKDSLGLGYAGLRPGPSWQMKRAVLTPRATPHWAELTTVRA